MIFIDGDFAARYSHLKPPKFKQIPGVGKSTINLQTVVRLFVWQIWLLEHGSDSSTL
jgi:hypothetical protein